MAPGWLVLVRVVGLINSDRLLWHLPQAYQTGQMDPVDPRAAEGDNAAHGLAPEKTQVFLRYDRLDVGWHGWLYDYTKAR